jgi:hypothetical protein
MRRRRRSTCSRLTATYAQANPEVPSLRLLVVGAGFQRPGARGNAVKASGSIATPRRRDDRRDGGQPDGPRQRSPPASPERPIILRAERAQALNEGVRTTQAGVMLDASSRRPSG